MNKFIKLFFISLIFCFSCYVPSFAEFVNPNAPVLLDDMTPVKWINDFEYDTDKDDADWYNYDNQKWANAKDGDGNYWVWIPRYTYKIDKDENGNDKIFIKWSVGVKDDIENGYVVHPAFVSEAYIGGDPNELGSYKVRLDSNQLPGFWIAKYMMGKDGEIKPDNQPEINKSIGEAFKSCLEMRDELWASSHLTKASEWGAVAYLASVIGNMPKENASELTGGDIKTSTTENIYGVFDMHGLAGEYLSAFVIKDTLDPSVLGYVGDLDEEEYERFVDVVNLTSTDNDANNNIRLRDFYGFGVSETNGFDTSIRQIPTGHYPFFSKGASNVGLLGYSRSNGKGLGFRPTLSIYTSYLSEDVLFFDTEASVVSGDHLIVSVNFSVDKDWKFPLNNGEVIIQDGNVVDAKRLFDFIDLRYVQNNKMLTFSNAELNETLISIIEERPDGKNYKVEKLDYQTTFKSGCQYTIRVRIGGYEKDQNGNDKLDSPVFISLPGMTTRIVVDSIKVKSADASGNELSVVKVPNNKIRLSIYDELGRVPVLTEVKLVNVPVKKDYYKGERLSLVGGKIEVSYGNNKATIDLTKDNVVNFDTITQRPGADIPVELTYNGMVVTQTNDKKYEINVRDVREFYVDGNSSPNNTANIVSGIGKHPENERVNLKAALYPGYKFKNWTSSDITITNTGSIDGAYFNMPSKDVTVIANTVGVHSLEVQNVKKVFERGDVFNLGGGKIVAHYPEGFGSEDLGINDNGVKVILKKDGKEVVFSGSLVLDELGTWTVIIEYGGKRVSYDITVTKEKYTLSIEIEAEEYGEVNLNGKTVLPVDGKLIHIEKVSYDDIVSLNATSKEGYFFTGWYCSESGLILDTNLANRDVSFVMPPKNVMIKANFIREYTVTYLVNNGNYGYIDGTKVQKVPHGRNSTEVTAVANATHKFKRWNDGNLLPNRAEQYVTSDLTYTAEFVKTWVVKYMVDGREFASRVIEDGDSGYISEIPKKYGEFFTNWDVDLSCVKNDIVTNAVFEPIISITPNGNNTAKESVIAKILGKGIKPGTLEYIISDSPTHTGENVSDYRTNDIFKFDGNWQIDTKNPELYRSYVGLGAKNDSSTTITISSKNDRELVRFEYMLSVASGQGLGITVNGEKITSFDDQKNVWHSFDKEVRVINGKIVIGISYSQDSTFNSSDFAAIKNLKTGRHWIPIENEYDLNDSVTWTENYVHIRGVVLDEIRNSNDGKDLYPEKGIYQICSGMFKGITEKTTSHFNINYELNGATDPGNPKLYSAASNDITLINPTKVGATFIGWTGSNGDIPEITVKIPKGSIGNRMYIANWQVNTYLIEVVNNNGGIISPGNIIVEYNKEATFSIVPNTGYKIKSLLVDGRNVAVNNVFGMTYTFSNVTSTHIISATYDAVVYNITYDLAGGTASGNPATYTVMTDTIVLNKPTKSGSVFAGWSTSKKDTNGEAIFLDLQTDITILKGSVGDRKYFANWTTEYVITYNANGGSNAPQSQKKMSGETVFLSSVEPTKAGYTFMGWNTNNTSSGEHYAKGGKYSEDKSVTLYAEWYCSGATQICTTSSCSSSSISSVNCSACSGKGEITCSTCTAPVTCTDCNGTKKQECNGMFEKVTKCGDCGGTCGSSYKCSVCGSVKGYCTNGTPHNYGGTHTKINCVRCQGTGKIACEHGFTATHELKVSCNVCLGSKTVPSITACSHGYHTAHRYCSHYNNTLLTTHNYCSHGRVEPHVN